MTASQNKEQKDNPSYSGIAGRFSYTKYDGLGRITEVGEKSTPVDIRDIDLLDSLAVKSWVVADTNRQVTKTIYDDPVNISLQSSVTSRKRVVASIYLENATDAEGDSTLYSYDIIGNVNTLVQHVKALVAVDATNGKKRIDYDYDLVSGKVNTVSYQEGKGDQFFYKYRYDADNRVTRALTSRDKLIWNEEASYLYYLHGPLARTELGNLKVQGVDYAYTLQGWLKGINSDSLNPAKEMGNDGYAGSTYSRVSRDVYGFKLGYYTNDYQSIAGSSAPAFSQQAYMAPSSLEATGNQLFNGNISFTTLALSKINNGATAGYSYGYDQLNRLVHMRQHSVTGSWSNSDIITAYSESIAYDANGNILKYLRNGANTMSAPLKMDSLGYKYNRDEEGYLVNNRLNHIRDSVGASSYSVDIDDQSANNYLYDKTGNLVKDVAEGLDTVRWTVYEKINRIGKNANMVINYGYDPMNNRTLKQVIAHDTTTNTYYIRDGQGTVLGVYTYFKPGSGGSSLKWSEQHLYGSSRLGMWQWDTVAPALPPVVTGSPIYDSLRYGSRVYELSNHLGNVLSTINDKKIGNDSSGIVNYYIAEVLSQNDYYPFGMLQPERKYSLDIYRYGFNGKENDNVVKGEGNQEDYGMRIYDPRIGKFLSVDLLIKSFPWWTPYQFAGNTPMQALDLDGKEIYYYVWNQGRQDETALQRIGQIDVVEQKNDIFILTDLFGAQTSQKMRLQDLGIEQTWILYDNNWRLVPNSKLNQSLDKISKEEWGAFLTPERVEEILQNIKNAGDRAQIAINIAMAADGLKNLYKAIRQIKFKNLTNKISKIINKGQQDKHIPGTNNYKVLKANGANKSILTEDAQNLLDDVHAGNINDIQKAGEKLRVDFGKTIGKYVDPVTGQEIETTIGLISNGKNGAHIVPGKPN